MDSPPLMGGAFPPFPALKVNLDSQIIILHHSLDQQACVTGSNALSTKNLQGTSEETMGNDFFGRDVKSVAQCSKVIILKVKSQPISS